MSDTYQLYSWKRGRSREGGTSGDMLCLTYAGSSAENEIACSKQPFRSGKHDPGGRWGVSIPFPPDDRAGKRGSSNSRKRMSDEQDQHKTVLQRQPRPPRSPKSGREYSLPPNLRSQ